MSHSQYTAPQTVAALRELVIAIGRGEAAMSLGTKAHLVLGKLVDRPDEVAVRNISELSTTLGINPSTLTRLATRLGYSSFGAFQAVFRDNVTQRARPFYSQQMQRLVDDGSAAECADEVAVMLTLAHESIRNVDGFVTQLDPGELASAARLLARAPRVRVYGLRMIHALASFLTYGLGMLRGDVCLLDTPGLGLAEGLAQLEPGDVLVVSSVVPYTCQVADAARLAAENGVLVIALTDTRASPLVPPAKHAFYIPHDSSFISNSMGAYIVFCEGLLNLVARELGDRAVEALKRREQLIEQLNIEAN